MKYSTSFYQKHVCNCSCHTKGIDTMHFTSCCSLCYEKYIKANGQYDYEVLDKLLEERIIPELKITRIDGSEYICQKSKYITNSVIE